MVYYAPSRFAPRPRKAAPSGAVAHPVRTVADGQDPDDIVCIRIRARNYASGLRIRHDIVCFNDRFDRVLLSQDPAAELDERAALLTMMLDAFPGVDWTRDHQIVIGGDGTTIHAAPDVDEPGFIPEDDGTFGTLKPPVQAARPWHGNVPTLPALERAA